MKLSNKYNLSFYSIIVAVCFLFVTASGAQAQSADINKIWTTVGSAGTVDETDVTKVFLDKGFVQMGRPLIVNQPADKLAKQNAAVIPRQTKSAVIRYNVTPVDGLFFPTSPGCQPGTGTSCQGVQMTLRYLASGAGGRLAARLIEVDLATGTETPRLTFNSSSAASSNAYQVQTSLDCGPRWHFDFTTKGYYIEATLTNSIIFAGSAAGIQMIKVGKGVC